MLFVCFLLAAVLGGLVYVAVMAVQIHQIVQELRSMADHPAGRRLPLDPRW